MNGAGEGLRDIKGPLSLSEPVWPVVVLVIVVLLAAAGGIYFWLKKRKNPRPGLSASGKALQELEVLKRESSSSLEEIHAKYVRLDEILRRYVEARFQIRAPEMTTPEFLRSLKTAPELKKMDQSALKKFLEISELVKFARHRPPPEEIKEGLDAVESFVRQTRETEEEGHP